MAGPLAGVKVLDLSQIVSGPMATAWLADQGAEVVKLESPSGDPVRFVGARKGTTSAIHVAVNRGKRGEILDLKDPAQHARFAELVGWADVLVENFRPGTMERLGWPWERARALNPGLIWCSITGFGPSGPYANLRAYDPVVQAASGLCAIQADPDGTPRLVGTLVCDKVTALTAAQAITAALFHRARTGEGQRIDIAMLDAAIAFNWVEGMYNLAFVEGADPAPEYASLARLWRTKDGWVSCSMLQDSEFRALREALGNPPELMDPALETAAGRLPRLAELLKTMARLCAERTCAELMDGFIRAGAVGCRVNSRAEVLDDPQVRHNGCLVEVDQGEVGRVRVARHPVRFSATPAVDRPGPAPDGPQR
ncbi:MAG: CoA transferase [Sphingomonadaceae bacterium]|uniref:CaiB/BaiF CoA transferase family protein n=1 Tax=Thermaurantiacus sp. TaxID=2820283 RepID=UPI00298F0C5F|nr:CoA transferase [Thermaurantiacus sp.]MCS6986731.1 CoA transferase [Sphingomonadaceae bacterium]MDW8414006.1 CoA transferase [Thermaurantiacus sp.]